MVDVSVSRFPKKYNDFNRVKFSEPVVRYVMAHTHSPFFMMKVDECRVGVEL